MKLVKRNPPPIFDNYSELHHHLPQLTASGPAGKEKIYRGSSQLASSRRCAQLSSLLLSATARLWEEFIGCRNKRKKEKISRGIQMSSFSGRW